MKFSLLRLDTKIQQTKMLVTCQRFGDWFLFGLVFKKAAMAKTLWNGLIMIETNPVNHNWLDFVILSGLALHQFQRIDEISFSAYFTTLPQ